jgi:CheY-like chemotaxis protein
MDAGGAAFRNGHEVVDMAASGERALASAAEFQPDLIMMDINLGRGINGIEAAQGIKKQQSANIIFVSAYGDPETRAQVQEAVPGAPLLTKPVDLASLKKTISRVRRPTH